MVSNPNGHAPESYSDPLSKVLTDLVSKAEPPLEFLHKVVDAWNCAEPSQSLQAQEIRSVLSYIEVSINSDRSLKLAASVIARVYVSIPHFDARKSYDQKLCFTGT